MKHARKTVSLLLAMLLLIPFATGCGNSENPQPSAPYDDTDSFYSSSVSQPPALKEIEITLENWDTYFEFVGKEEEFKNDYNETEHITNVYYLSLKDGFVMNEDGTDIAVKYSYHYALYEAKEDLINKKIIWGELLEEKEEPVVRETNIRRDDMLVAGEMYVIFSDRKPHCSDFKIDKIYGTLSIWE